MDEDGYVGVSNDDGDFLGYESADDEPIYDVDTEPPSDSENSNLPANMGNLALFSQETADDGDNETSTRIFNEDLPAAHSYLGDDLEEVQGRKIFTECQYVIIPILSGVYRPLLPGQTFPLTVRDHSSIEMLRMCLQSDHTFGCVASRATPGKSVFGTTVEIYEYSDDLGSIRIKGKGRQRFKVICTRNTETRYKLAEVYILPEIKLQHPFTTLQITSLKGLRVSNKEKCRKIESNCLAWPKWVYDMYDSEKLAQRANCLRYLKQGLRKEKGLLSIPDDITELSFWIGSLMDTERRLFILTLNSPIQRLRWLLGFLKRNHEYICQSCETLIAKQGDVFAMSAEGAQGTYVNAGGYHHDTITVLKAENIDAITAPSTHFSWFPGYAWSIAVCRNCHKHLGWQFISVDTQLPKKFWGLSRQALDTELVWDDKDCDPADMPII